jgi:hypothetical protein
MDDTDEILTIGEAESFVQNAIEVRYFRGQFSVEVDNPWAGSTETGFGYTCSVNLTDDQARELAAFIIRKLATPSPPSIEAPVPRI